MTKPTEAQRLADDYGRAYATAHIESLYGANKSYAKERAREANEARELLHAELLRLEAANAELLEALKDMAEHYGCAHLDKAREAIKKHGGAA